MVAGLDTREHGPADLSRVAGSLFQDPESQVVLTTVRAELAFPLENRGHGPAAVARGVEEAALALGIARCWTAQRPSSAAASYSVSRWVPRWPAARSSCSWTSRPRSWTPSRATS